MSSAARPRLSAYDCINDPNPKLTVLERAFWVAARKGR